MTTPHTREPWYKKIRRQVLVLAAFVLLIGVGAPLAHAWVINVYPVTYTAVSPGGYTTISWTAPTSDYCTIAGPTITASTPGASSDHGLYYVTIGGANGSYYTGPINGSYTYAISCVNVNGGGGGGTGSNTVTVVPSAPDNCPGNPTAVAGGMQVPPGTYHVVAQGSDFCITNNSGRYVFVPTNSATEVNNFKAATQGYLAGTIAYFARTAGY